MYTATYSPDDNKLRLYSVGRLDPETYARVKAAGFGWAPKQDLFVAPMWTPEREDLLIELCDEIGDEDTSLVDRAAERADRFEDYSEKRAADSERAAAAVRRIADGIPLGQPILVGHHSERHARKDAERIENGMRKAVNLWKTSGYWTQRAEGALRHAKYKELPTVRARRIKKLESERRGQVRHIDNAERFTAAWGKVDLPVKDAEGFFGADPGPEVRRARAIYVANHDGGSFASSYVHPSGYVGPISLWAAVGGNINDADPETTAIATVDEVRARALATHAATIARAQRWIEHYDRRLEYERAMLEEQGKTHLLAPKARPALLPLCNYRAPGGLSIPNQYHRGEMIHYPQVEMTQAEYAKIYTDYKGTRHVNGSHRVRTALVGGAGGAERRSLACVFLTDAKVHTPPAPVVRDEARPAPATRPEPERARVHVEPAQTEDPGHAKAIAAMAESLKSGVSVVVAPQLFPTPPDIARRMAEAANLEDGLCVLEPSAGTGNLAAAVHACVDTEVLAYEINGELCASLARRFPSHKTAVRRADFLTVTEHQGCYQRILMNPPFERGADLEHIAHARRFLAPGGRLVALCADGPRQRAALQPIATSYESLPEGSFASQGTGVRVAMVILDAPGESAR